MRGGIVELILCFRYVGSGNWTQAIGLGGKHLYLLRHLIDSMLFLNTESLNEPRVHWLD